ncbi:Na+/H+ antiporter subunit E [Paenibacillus sambharensis]|uniref:Na+/H+ antiporter subunit E n=1 Tax=Paenibacillus sambharensis TaxID=1803190 RepID=A0A2W1LNT2_9BACL|nr:Na+/H+ antiporter subunit E [Paenibacillus sambharensis]PZD96154.1 Na+/H+ antiporter subunit E [Paenibacillus sambharensis]
MASQILLNLLIAFVWMFLKNTWNPATFIVGYLIGLLFLFMLRRFLNGEFYMRRIGAIVNLILLFLKELLLSNITVIKEIVRPRLRIRPGIFTLKTELKSDWEVTVLACLITLTPGTLTLEVSPDNSTLYIHAMDIEDAEMLEKQIKGSFEKAIMEVSR